MADYYTNTSDYSKPIVQQQPIVQPIVQQPMTNNDSKSLLYDYNPFDFDWKDITKRGIKYLFEGVAVAFVAYAFTKGKLNIREILMLGITAAFVFAILDTFSPTISLGARFGAGFGIGQSIFGVGGMPMATSLLM